MGQPHKAFEYIVGHDELWSEHLVVANGTFELSTLPLFQGGLEPVIYATQLVFPDLDSVQSLSLFQGRHCGGGKDERVRVAYVTT